MIKKTLRAVILLLFFIPAAVFAVENPSEILFIEMTGRKSEKNAEIYSLINQNFIKILKSEFSDKISITRIKNNRTDIDSNSADAVRDSKKPEASLVIYGKIRPLWGKYRADISLSYRNHDTFTMNITFDKKGSVIKADELSDFEYRIASANNFFLKNEKKHINKQRSAAVLDIHIPSYITSKEFNRSEKEITALLKRKGKGLIRIPEEERYRHILKDPGRNFNSDERLLKAGRILSCRWIIYSMLYMDKKKYGQYIYLYDTKAKSVTLVINTESQNRNSFLKETENRLDEFILKISEKDDYFLHKNNDIGFIMDIDNFGYRSDHTLINPGGMTIDKNGNLVAACWMDVVILSEFGKLLGYIGETGSGQGKYQGAYRIGSDKKMNHYILDSTAQKIIIYNKNKPVKEFRINESYPQSFAVSDTGFSFVPDQMKNTLSIYSQTGRMTNAITLEGMRLLGVNPGHESIVSLWSYNNGSGYMAAQHGNSGDITDKRIIPLKTHLLSIWKFTTDKESRIYCYDNVKKNIFRINRNNRVEYVLNEIQMNNRKSFGNIIDIAVNAEGDTVYLLENPGKRIIKLKELKNRPRDERTDWLLNAALEYKNSNPDLFLYTINKIISQSPDNNRALILKAEFFLKQQHFSRAISLYERALENEPADTGIKAAINNSKFMMHLTNARHFKKRFIKTLKEIGPETARKDYTLAVAEYEKLIKISPNRNDINQEYSDLKKQYAAKDQRDTKASIEISDMALNNIFSAMYKYYADNPIGSLTVKNISKNKIDRLHAEIFIKKYMDYSTESRVYKAIGSGEQRSIKLNAVFNNKILSITEDSPFSFRIIIRYRIQGKEYTSESTGRVTVFNRNALTWETTEKLASFITPKETSVKIFARETIQRFRNSNLRFLNTELQSAMQVFHTLGIYGLTYVPDPKTPYKKFSLQKEQTDFVQYPRETLRFKTGDCDDLTALYCSLLENIGIETALVTVPGHIFMMFNTGRDAKNKKEISSTDSLTIIHQGKVWIPVEITAFGESFLSAWQKGSRHFIKVKPENIGIITTKESWLKYTPVTLDETGWEPALPQSGPAERLYFKDINSFIDSEISAKTEEIDMKLKKRKTPALLNRAGIIYAKYGKYEKASDLFNQSLVIDSRHFPSLFNLGNIAFIKQEYQKALAYYRRAASLKPGVAYININLSIVYAKLNDFRKAEKFYKIAVSLNPAMKKMNPMKNHDKNRADKKESADNIQWLDPGSQ